MKRGQTGTVTRLDITKDLLCSCFGQRWVGHEHQQTNEPGQALPAAHEPPSELTACWLFLHASSAIAGISGVMAKMHSGATQSGTGLGVGTPSTICAGDLIYHVQLLSDNFYEQSLGLCIDN